jgi:hypothetical protein
MTRVLWKVHKLDVTWPSVRVRALTPVMLLRRAGFDVEVTDRRPSPDTVAGSDVVVINKSFNADDEWLAAHAKESGKALIVDLCDDVFAESRAATAASFRRQAALADIVVTTGHLLRDAIIRQVPQATVAIVPDHAETLALTRDLIAAFPPSDRQQRTRVFGPGPLRTLLRKVTGRERALLPRRRTIVWFGLAGLAGQGVGIDALGAIAPQLNAVARTIPLQVLIVSSGHGRAKQVAQSFEFPWAFRDWALLSVYDHVANADVCVIPNPPTNYAMAKSPNRALLALGCGTPVIASASPAYAPLGSAIVCDDWERGLHLYLADPAAAATDVAAARHIIEREFGAPNVRDNWVRTFADAIARAKARGRVPT